MWLMLVLCPLHPLRSILAKFGFVAVFSRISEADKAKGVILTFDLICDPKKIMSVLKKHSLRAFNRCLAHLATTINLGVVGWGRPPSKSRGAKYPAANGLIKQKSKRQRDK